MICGRLTRLCGGVKPLLQDLVHQDGRSSADVERVDAPPEGQTDQVVAGISHPRPEASTLGTQDEDHPAAVIRAAVGRARTRGGAVAPALRCLRGGEEVREVAR